MSKQMPSSSWLPTSWDSFARTLYLSALRDAASIDWAPAHSLGTTTRRQEAQDAAHERHMLFCGQALAAQAQATDDTPPPPSDEGGVDPVLDELQRWDALGLKDYQKYLSPTTGCSTSLRLC